MDFEKNCIFSASKICGPYTRNRIDGYFVLSSLTNSVNDLLSK